MTTDTSIDDNGDQVHQVLARLGRIETLLTTLIEQRTVKDWYTVAEAATILNKAEFTVREWCRQGRVHAHKRDCGRGNSLEWIISHEEVTRIGNRGLLPLTNSYRHVR